MKKLIENKEGLKIFSKSDLLQIFPFGRTKLQQLLNAGVLPVVKIGKTYLTTDEMVQRWLMENVGKEILF
jgi:hypothetical protein